MYCYVTWYISFLPPTSFRPLSPFFSLPSLSLSLSLLSLFSTFLLFLLFIWKNHRLFKQTILFSLLTKSFLSTHTIFGSSVHYCSLCVFGHPRIMGDRTEREREREWERDKKGRKVWEKEWRKRMKRKNEERERMCERRKSEACVNITFIHCC